MGCKETLDVDLLRRIKARERRAKDDFHQRHVEDMMQAIVLELIRLYRAAAEKALVASQHRSTNPPPWLKAGATGALDVVCDAIENADDVTTFPLCEVLGRTARLLAMRLRQLGYLEKLAEAVGYVEARLDGRGYPLDGQQ